MKELLEIGLQIGGWSLVLLCIGSLWIPGILGWKEHLTALPPLMRELWWTYSVYVWSSHIFFSVLLLGFGGWLMGGTGAAMANLKSLALKRGLGWLIVAALVIATHFALRGETPFLRMVGLCCVLLGGMKGLVYAEWAGAEKLTLPRYGLFALLWFGMDPGTFRSTRAGLTWKRDVVLGSLLTVIGFLGGWFVWFMGWRQILVMFVPLSLAFHFGILRILKGLLRLAGFPVRTLFPNPLEAKGIADFWGRRWNVGYSQMLQRLVGRPVEGTFGKSAGVMAVFIASGMLHEVAITLPVRSCYGLPTLYFTFHGLLVLLEGKWQRPLGKIPALLAVTVPLAWLFPPAFQNEVIARFIEVFGVFTE